MASMEDLKTSKNRGINITLEVSVWKTMWSYHLYGKTMYWSFIVGLTLSIANVSNAMQYGVCCAGKGATQLTVLTWLVMALRLQPVEVVCFCGLLSLEESPCAHDLERRPRAS